MTISEYTAKIINKILFAASQDEVKRCTDEAIQALEKNSVNGHITARFLEKIIDELDRFNPMDKNSTQWSNISTAKVLLHRIKQKHNTTVS
jgi:hypothetical protein